MAAPVADVADAGFNRNVPIVLGLREWPAPARYDDGDLFDNDALIGRAAWFDQVVIDDEDLCLSYVNYHGFLPGDVPIAAITSWSWHNQFSCQDGDLIVGHGRTLVGLRADFARKALQGFERMRSKRKIPADMDCGIYAYQTCGEQYYLDAPNALPDEVIEGWRGQNIVSNAASVWDKHQLITEFRYSCKNKGTYWTVNVKNERRLGSKHGRPIPYQVQSTFSLRESFFRREFSELTQLWSRIEVLRGCAAELPMVFSYHMRELLDPQSGFWVVPYTEMAVKTATFILFDAYYNYRIWALSPTMIGLMRSLDLTSALGNPGDQQEFLDMLVVIEGTDFRQYHSSWSFRGKIESRSQGRVGLGADYVYFDPWTRELVSSDTGKALAAAMIRVPPDGHPRGWDFSAIPDGWESSANQTAGPLYATRNTRDGRWRWWRSYAARERRLGRSRCRHC